MRLLIKPEGLFWCKEKGNLKILDSSFSLSLLWTEGSFLHILLSNKFSLKAGSELLFENLDSIDIKLYINKFV